MPTPAETAVILREQARHCAAMGSPLYEHLLDQAADDAEAGGAVFDLLAPYSADGARAGALALRLMAAVHRLVLLGRAPHLARYYASVGGRFESGGGAFEAFRSVVIGESEALRPLVDRACQTNEVGRAAALVFGFLAVAARTGLPLRLLEVGASAGLNLRFDHFRYGGGGVSLGPADSPVNLEGLWIDAPPERPAVLTVAVRRGCDLRPVDPTTDEGRLLLLSSLWADQVERFSRLRGAIEIALRVPASVESASLAAWLPRQLADARAGTATVVYHSIVDEYLSGEERAALQGALGNAGSTSHALSPLFWLRLEPSPAMVTTYDIRLTSWPGAGEELLARSGAHGSDVRRA